MQYDDEILISYLEDTLPGDRKKELESRLKKDGELQKRLDEFRHLLASMQDSHRYDPGSDLDWEFRAKLGEMSAKTKPEISALRIAAAVALLIVGFAAGTLFRSPGPQTNLMALEQQINELQQLVVQQKLLNYSPSERLQAVSQIEMIEENPGDELMTTLIRTMTQDESPSVRYAAVQALGKYMHLDRARQALIRSLEQQEDALIQIAIINLLVEANEKAAISPMKKIIENETTSEEVVRQAQIAIDILI